MRDTKKTIGVRLAIRREGDFVNAYLASENTMEGATLLGSLVVGIAEAPEVFDAWKSLMTKAMAHAITRAFGQEPEFTERTAPEHEKAGRA